MRKDFQRRSLELTPAEWQALERLAAEHDTTAPTGATAGKPSWRSLIKAIANGAITLTPR